MGDAMAANTLDCSCVVHCQKKIFVMHILNTIRNLSHIVDEASKVHFGKYSMSAERKVCVPCIFFCCKSLILRVAKLS